MKIPYDEWDLRLALRELENNPQFTDDNLSKGLEELIEEFGPGDGGSLDKSELNKKIAAFHGITVEVLVNSPNYQILCEERARSYVNNLIAKIEEKLGITNKQAWALFAKGGGLI